MFMLFEDHQSGCGSTSLDSAVSRTLQGHNDLHFGR